MTTSFTTNFHLAKPDFRAPGWADAMNANSDAIDEALRNALMDTVPWTNNVAAGIGQVFLDTVTGAFWICSVSHTTTVAPGTFAQERAANPTFWTAFSFGIKVRGAWVNNTTYNVNDVAYDSVRGITGVVHTAHVSNASGSILDDAANWDFIVNLPTVFTARATSYDNSTSHLPAINIQDAVDAVSAFVSGAYVATNTSFNPTGTGMVATNVQAAIVETKADIDANSAAIVAANAAIASGILSTGFPHWRPTAETLAGQVIANGTTIGDALSGATQRANSDCAALYAWHWNNFSNTQCPVSTGRGANAPADFAAHKAITILDMKGMGPIGVDTMGGSATARLASVPITSGSTTAPGSVLGENLHTLSLAEIIAHYHAAGTYDPTHGHGVSGGIYGSTALQYNYLGGGGQGGQGGTITINASGTGVRVNSSNGLDTTYSAGGSGAHNNTSLKMTGYWYLHL